LKFLTRGLFALTLAIIFQSQLFAEYLYKDEVVQRANFQDQIELLGHELYTKTGISLKLVMIKELPKEDTIVAYEKEILDSFSEPTILLTFSELDTKIDILVNDHSLYKYFDRAKVLTPVASPVQAFFMAVMYAENFESFNKIRHSYGGSILPLLSPKTKPEQVVGMYAGAMYNGYLDIAQQVSSSKGIKLENDPGKTNETTIFYVRIFFYSFVLYGIVMIIRRTIYRMRHKNEK